MLLLCEKEFSLKNIGNIINSTTQRHLLSYSRYCSRHTLKVKVMSACLWPHGLWPTRLLCPWDFAGKNTGVGSHSLFQGISLIYGWNQRLLHCRQILYHWATKDAHHHWSRTKIWNFTLYYNFVSWFFHIMLFIGNFGMLYILEKHNLSGCVIIHFIDVSKFIHCSL